MPDADQFIPDSWPATIKSYGKGGDLTHEEDGNEFFRREFAEGWSWCVRDHKAGKSSESELGVRGLHDHEQLARVFGYRACERAYEKVKLH